MKTVWVLVCDAAKARFFETNEGDPAWHLVDEVFHDESRRKVAELTGDRSGSRAPRGPSVHHNALASRSSPKDVEKERFARLLAEMLDAALGLTRFLRWVLVAPPPFVGMMRKELSPALSRHLLTTVDSDLGHLDAHALAEKLAGAVRIPRGRGTLPDTTKRPH